MRNFLQLVEFLDSLSTGAALHKIISFAEKTFLILLTAAVLVRVAPEVPDHPHLIIFIFTELVGVALILFQRSGVLATGAFPVTVAFIGTGVALLVFPNGKAVAPEYVSQALVFGGAFIALMAKLSLGRSFGIVAANRGVQRSGVYRIVRHPMYLGYMVNHVGFLLLYLSPWNLAVYAISWTALWLRTVEEEKILTQDPAYKSYAAEVRYRLVPGVI